MNIAMLYDDASYQETLGRPKNVVEGQPMGLMGRQVAGKEFLDGYLSYGSWTSLIALTQKDSSAKELYEYCQNHPSSRRKKRGLRSILQKNFSKEFFPDPPASLIYTPHPPDSRFVWARQCSGTPCYSVSGVTHTLSSQRAIAALCQIVTAPYEPYDSLICTSQAVVNLVRSVTTCYAEYLRDRFGGEPNPRIRIEHIPLGVNPERYQVPTPEQRQEARHNLGAQPDECVVLFVGRLSHHAKAQPFPMFQAISLAARQTGKKAHLILCGWSANASIRKAFEDGAKVFAPNVRVSFVDGVDPQLRFAVWKAADIFTSLSDNVQETFGLVVIEAMSCGLPVVATDWNGYRDLVINNKTGFLVPTCMVSEATASTTTRLVLGEINYDHYLAEVSQATAVDVPATAESFSRLLLDENLRRQMGAAGRRHVMEHFTWERVIRAYEALWQEQEEERVRRADSALTEKIPAPACYAPPEHTFAGYPTTWLQGADMVQSLPESLSRLHTLLQLPLTNHEAMGRVSDMSVLQTVIRATTSPRTIAELDELLRQSGAHRECGRATLAWMLKYNLLRIVSDQIHSSEE